MNSGPCQTGHSRQQNPPHPGDPGAGRDGASATREYAGILDGSTVVDIEEKHLKTSSLNHSTLDNTFDTWGGELPQELDATQVPVSEVMSPNVLTAAPSTSIAALYQAFESRGISGVPVVDDHGKPIGVVSKTDLVRALLEQRLDGSCRVDRIMTAAPFTLPDSVSLAQAAALLAFEGIHRVLLVDVDGRITGVLTSIDLARWMSQKAGFVIPSYTQRQRRRAARAEQLTPADSTVSPWERACLDFRNRVSQQFAGDLRDLIFRAHDRLLALPRDVAERTLRAASILVDEQADAVTVASTLLAAVVRADKLSTAQLSREFDPAAGRLVQTVAPALVQDDGDGERVAALRVLFATMAHDVRAVLVHISLRLAELERSALRASHGDPADVERASRFAADTLDIYVPLAGQMGLHRLRSRLEDLCFRLIEPDTYRELSAEAQPIRDQDEACLAVLREGVIKLLRRNGLRAEVTGRTKGLFSVYRKMQRKRASLHQIMDTIGLRVVVKSVPDCYRVLGLIHTHFRPIPDTFDDYIGQPKPNGYQSLHTCVYPLRGVSQKPVEFQIRTELMHAAAEFGVAAHWRYKSAEAAQRDTDHQLRWLRDLSETAERLPPENFVAELRRQLFAEHVVVYFPDGQQVAVPAGATAGDVLARLAPADGEILCTNGQPSDLARPLRDGDTLSLEPELDPEALQNEA